MNFLSESNRQSLFSFYRYHGHQPTVLREFHKPAWDIWTEGWIFVLDEVDSVTHGVAQISRIVTTLDGPASTFLLYWSAERQTLLPAMTQTQRYGIEDCSTASRPVFRSITSYSCPFLSSLFTFHRCTRAAGLCFCVRSTRSSQSRYSCCSSVRILIMKILGGKKSYCILGISAGKVLKGWKKRIQATWMLISSKKSPI